MSTIFKTVGQEWKPEFLTFIIIKIWDKKLSTDQFMEGDIFEYFSESYEKREKRLE